VTSPRRLGSSFVNFFAVEDGGRWTLLDAGLPAFWPQLEQNGISPDAVEAVVLTHPHSDHVGVAERLRQHGARVYVHESDRDLALHPQPIGDTERSLISYWHYPTAWRLKSRFARHGGSKLNPIGEVTTFSDGEQIDAPGRPQIIHTPGHTDGHSVLQLEDGTLILGDLLCTWNPLTGQRGPQLIPAGLSKSSAEMLASLDRLEHLDAPALLFGHGEAWDDGAASAVAHARALGPT
jgi:glyoxylase-like metal-dependent hydrolase (beta-lactamase superfamily II)